VMSNPLAILPIVEALTKPADKWAPARLFPSRLALEFLLLSKFSAFP
jgi:hypothetical protein